MKSFLLLTLFLIPIYVFGATNCKSIDGNFKFAWGDYIGWVNFDPVYGNVRVCDDELIGYAWSENYGWINLSPTNGGVFNDGNGNLSGYAWGENLGWIDFNNVKINPNTGEFSGYAIILGGPGGKINFDCSNCKVKTEWRKVSVSLPQVSGSYLPQTIAYPTKTTTTTDINSLLNLLIQLLSKPPEVEKEITSPLLKPEKESKIIIELPAKEEIKPEKEIKPISEISYLALPDKIQDLLNKFTALKNLFNILKIKSLEDLRKISEITFRLPSINDFKQIPEEFIFAKIEKIYIKPYLIIESDYIPLIYYNLPTDKKITFIVKPKYEVEKIIGDIELINLSSKLNLFNYIKGLISNITKQNYSHNKNTQEIKFNGPYEDGTYRAEFITPKEEGYFKVLVDIYYKKLHNKKIEVGLNIKEKGSIKEKILFLIERKISNAFVYLYKFNEKSKVFELWDAKEYLQNNPQITDREGKYSFIVPEGFYYLEVQKSGYFPFRTKIFKAFDGDLINFDIELVSIYNLILFVFVFAFILILVSLIVFRIINKIL